VVTGIGWLLGDRDPDCDTFREPRDFSYGDR
jgi:hypothetical protein